MSADSGVYILRTMGEWRVAVIQEVGRVNRDERNGRYEEHNDDVRIENARTMWAEAPVYMSGVEAFRAAITLYESLPGGAVEYGLSIIDVDRAF